MDDFQEWLEEHWLGIVVGGVAIAALVTQIPSIQETMRRNQAVASANQLKLEQNQKLEAERLVREASQEIANERYDKGCEVIATLKDPRLATTIKEGQPILDGAFAHLYRDGKRKMNPDHFIGRDITICDLYGTTAIMQFDPKKNYAVVGSIAVTSDRDLMKKAQERMKEMIRPSFKTSSN